MRDRCSPDPNILGRLYLLRLSIQSNHVALHFDLDPRKTASKAGFASANRRTTSGSQSFFLHGEKLFRFVSAAIDGTPVIAEVHAPKG